MTTFDMAAAYRETSTAYALLGFHARCEELRRLDRQADETP